jgi:hypothetical protein
LWAAVVVVAGALVVLAALAFELGAPRVVGGGTVAHPSALAGHAVGARLPLPAEGPVSRIFGRDDHSYCVVWDGAGLELRNPRERVGAWFDRRGLVIRSGRAWLGLGLSGYGYGRSLRAVGVVVPVAQANRVVYRHGGIEEWFANGPLGLEQGFGLAARPGTGHGLLTLSLGAIWKSAWCSRAGHGALYRPRGVARLRRPGRF